MRSSPSKNEWMKSIIHPNDLSITLESNENKKVGHSFVRHIEASLCNLHNRHNAHFLKFDLSINTTAFFHSSLSNYDQYRFDVSGRIEE